MHKSAPDMQEQWGAGQLTSSQSALVGCVHVENGAAVGRSAGWRPLPLVDRVIGGLEAASPVRGKVACGAAARCDGAVARIVPVCCLQRHCARE